MSDEALVPATVGDNDFSDAAPCTNCGHALQGVYCASCGQHRRSLHHSVWAFVRESLSELFESDARLWRTLGPLFFSPGYLSADYLAGRRARYLPPLRLYLGASLVFFLLSALLGDSVSMTLDDSLDEEVAVHGIDLDSPEDIRVVAGEGLPSDAADQGQDKKPAIVVSTDADITDKISLGSDSPDAPEWLRPLLKRLEVSAMAMVKDPSSFIDAMSDMAPSALFLTLPIFALLTRLLWFGSGRWYVEHLVFSLHLFSQLFLALSLMAITERLSTSDAIISVFSKTLDTALTLYVLWYWLTGFRAFLGGSWSGTVVRGGVLALLYLIVLLLAFLVVVLIVLLSK